MAEHCTRCGSHDRGSFCRNCDDPFGTIRSLRADLTAAKEALAAIHLAAREYIEAHALMAVRLQDAEHGERYKSAAKALEALVCD